MTVVDRRQAHILFQHGKERRGPKTLQCLVGRSAIGATLNTYTHLGFEDAQAELERVASGGQ
jgi:hypothetical protein